MTTDSDNVFKVGKALTQSETIQQFVEILQCSHSWLTTEQITKPVQKFVQAMIELFSVSSGGSDDSIQQKCNVIPDGRVFFSEP